MPSAGGSAGEPRGLRAGWRGRCDGLRWVKTWRLLADRADREGRGDHRRPRRIGSLLLGCWRKGTARRSGSATTSISVISREAGHFDLTRVTCGELRARMAAEPLTVVKCTARP